MAPDFEYFIRGRPYSEISHSFVGQFLFCLPLTLCAVFAIKRIVAAPLFAHVGLVRFAGLDGIDRSYWPRAAISALVGSISHCWWDGFTHAYGWFVLRIELLQRPLFAIGDYTVFVYKLLQHGSTIGGALIALGLLRRIELDPPSLTVTEASRRRFRIGGALLIASSIAIAALTSTGAVNTTLRATFLIGVGALPLAMVVRRSMSAGKQDRTGPAHRRILSLK